MNGLGTAKIVLKISESTHLLLLQLLMQHAVGPLHEECVEIIRIGRSIESCLVNGHTLIPDYGAAGLELVEFGVFNDNFRCIVIQLDEAVELISETPKPHILETI